MAYASKSYTPFPAEKKIQYKIIHAGVTFSAYNHFLQQNAPVSFPLPARMAAACT